MKGESVIRFVPTYVNKDGMRTLMRSAQGRFTYETEAEAQAWIDAVTTNNGGNAIREAWGDNPQFAVRPCPCYPVHFDPQGVWFDLATPDEWAREL